MNLTPNRSSHSFTTASPSTPSASDDHHSNIIQKFLTDLEEIVKSLAEQQATNPNHVFSDDCIDLQKFCFKLEFLLQYKLKEKKSLFESTLTVSSQSTDNYISAYASKDYWTFFVEVFKSSRGFQDAIKYVRGLNELKTNLGRGRAFIRFCLQYHRLADAVQQLVMDEKIVNNWYKEKAVWFDSEQKNRIFQLLYDLNDVNFELLSGSNFELDTTWPTIHMNNPNNPRIHITRHRTNSITSYTSYYHEKSADNGETSNLLSSTPLEMDSEFLISKMNRSESNQDDNRSVDIHSTYQLEIEQQESKINELTARLALKDNQLDTVIGELKKKGNIDSSISENTSRVEVDTSDSTMFLEKMATQISTLNEQLTSKVYQNNELNECLVKQTNLCDTLSEILKTAQDRLAGCEAEKIRSSSDVERLQADFDELKKDYTSKVEQEKKLIKEIVSLKEELATLANTREAEKSEKEEANRLLDTQFQEITQALEIERQKVLDLENEISELRNSFRTINDKNRTKIEQLEDDNNEIKKRLVKLIKEKAELWQKADNLEYENLCKVNAMWVDDANVTSCTTCSSTFNLLLRKHHCRICLKIYCYYCCNNWIDYNNSKLRCCQRCFETKTVHSHLSENIEKISTKSDDIKQLGADSIVSSTTGNEAEDESDPDINFEVRSEQLHLPNEQHQQSIYKTNMVDAVDQEKMSVAVPGNPFEETESTNPFEQDEINEAKIKEALASYENLNSIEQEQAQQKAEADSTKFDNELTSIYSDDASDLVIRKKVLKRKKKTSESSRSIDDMLSPRSLNGTLERQDDSFTILSQEEIDRTK